MDYTTAVASFIDAEIDQHTERHDGYGEND